MGGFVAVRRDALDHPHLQNPHRFCAWIWLVLHARWTRDEVSLRGRLAELKPGWVVATDNELAAHLGWNKLSVRRCLRYFERAGMIEVGSLGHRTVITILDRSTFALELSEGDGDGVAPDIYGIAKAGQPVFGREREPMPKTLRDAVIARDGKTCRYCREDTEEIDIDHIHQVALGGGNEMDNLCVACPPCNRSKGAKTLQQWQLERTS